VSRTLSLWILLSTGASAAVPEPDDWTAVGQQTAERLSRYLQVDTVNPPGRELAGAEFLAAELAAAGIASEIHLSAPERGNLVARLPSSGEGGPPICLLSHIDVVPSERAGWPDEHAPLSGDIDADGVVWGRGALDMKGMTAIQLQAMLELHSRRLPLKRDLILLAVADEEVDNTGVKWVIDNLWDELACGHVINEGGMGLIDLFFEGQTVYPISVGEKGVLWLRMIASAEPGHGSTPVPDRSPQILLEAMERIAERPSEPVYHPALLELLSAAGAAEGGFSGAVLQRPGLIRMLLQGRLMSDPLTRAAITDTVNLTGFGGALSPNVVPGESWANLDIRLQPGTDPAEIRAELEALVADLPVRFEVLSEESAAVSPWEDDPLYAALATRLVEEDPHAVTGPAISVGFTDSIYLRQIPDDPPHAYGMVPFALTKDQILTMHGNGEHVSTANLEQGVRVLYRALADVAADPQGTWRAPSAPQISLPETETEAEAETETETETETE